MKKGTTVSVRMRWKSASSKLPIFSRTNSVCVFDLWLQRVWTGEATLPSWEHIPTVYSSLTQLRCRCWKPVCSAFHYVCNFHSTAWVCCWAGLRDLWSRLIGLVHIKKAGISRSFAKLPVNKIQCWCIHVQLGAFPFTHTFLFKNVQNLHFYSCYSVLICITLLSIFNSIELNSSFTLCFPFMF